jgi:hypothetical protein
VSRQARPEPAPETPGSVPATPDAAPATVDRGTAWRTPTRRAFVGMIAAGAAALAVQRPVRNAIEAARSDGDAGDDADRPRSTWTGTTRWIGHC